MSTAAALSAIETLLVEAAEARALNKISPELYKLMVDGACVHVPKPLSPDHVPVMNAIGKWRRNELISEVHREAMTEVVLAASAPVDSPPGSAAKPAASSTTPTSKSPKSKLQKLLDPRPGEQSVAALPGVQKQVVRDTELRKQREEAAAGRNYEPLQAVQEKFNSELKQERDAGHPDGRSARGSFPCSKCTRVFDTRLGRENHELRHSAAAQRKVFAPPPPLVVGCEFGTEMRLQSGWLGGRPTTEGGNGEDMIFTAWEQPWVTFTLRVEGKTHAEWEQAQERTAKEEAEREAVRAERARLKDVERKRRERLREAEAEAEVGEHRQGSMARKQWPVKKKLKVLDFLDKVLDDETIKQKKTFFEADPRSLGAAWSTVCGTGKWNDPTVRAKLSKAAAQEGAAELLRVDKESRKKGKFVAMEKEVFAKFKVRRSKGRKCSARWLTAIARNVMLVMYGQDVAATFKGGKDWRKRWRKRYRVSIRKKTNCKTSTWAETKPVLENYFRAFRRRLIEECVTLEELQSAATLLGLAELEELQSAATLLGLADDAVEDAIDEALRAAPGVMMRIAKTPTALASTPFTSLLAALAKKIAPAYITIGAAEPAAEPTADPEDISPEREDNGLEVEEDDNREDVLDSSDDEAMDEDERANLLKFEPPDGFRVAPPPPPEQLEHKNKAGEALVERFIMMDWTAVGWCVGEIRGVNLDGRVKRGGYSCNFHIYYDIDGQTPPHALLLDDYAKQGEGGAWLGQETEGVESMTWVLLEAVPAA